MLIKLSKRIRPFPDSHMYAILFGLGVQRPNLSHINYLNSMNVQNLQKMYSYKNHIICTAQLLHHKNIVISVVRVFFSYFGSSIFHKCTNTLYVWCFIDWIWVVLIESDPRQNRHHLILRNDGLLSTIGRLKKWCDFHHDTVLT